MRDLIIGHVEDAKMLVEKARMIISCEELPDKEAVDMLYSRMTDAINELDTAIKKTGLTRTRFR